MQLRPYQQQGVDDLAAMFKDGKKRLIFCLPTGAGKTVCFSTIAKKAVENGSRVMILTNRTELLTQAGGTLIKVGLKVEAIKAGQKFLKPSMAYVAMVETLYRRVNRLSFRQALGQLDLIIIDEAHIGAFRKIIEAFPDSHIIGATATPLASSKKHPLIDFYDDIVEPVTIAELIDQKFLVPAKTYGAKEEIGKLQVKNGEYTDQSQMDFFNKKAHYDGVVIQYQKLAPGKKAICFCVNQEHAVKTAEAFNEAGIAARFIVSDGKLCPAEMREKNKKDFAEGKFQVLVNCGILTTGYDEPSIECVIMDRKTKSLPLWMQCCGRGSRLYPGKEFFTIIDMGSNFLEHGLWQQDTDWTEIFRNPTRSNSNINFEAPTKKCPKCDFAMHPTASNCKECGYSFPPPEQKFEKATEFVEVTLDKWLNYDLSQKPEQMSVEELEFLQQAKGYKPGWLHRQLRTRGREALAEYAAMKGYKAGWVQHQMQMK
jgi:superfamily II DNA or RNA helicase